MKNPNELLYGEEFKKVNDLFKTKLTEWKENNKELLIENNLEDSNLFTITYPDNSYNIQFDKNIPEQIITELENLFKSCLHSDEQDQ